MNARSKFSSSHFDRWRSRLREVTPTTVAREMAEEYGVGQDTLAFMVAELYRGTDTRVVHMVWDWDMDHTGQGLSDKEVDDFLSTQRL